MAKANEIYMTAVKLESGDKAVIDLMDFSYLVRMADALERINDIQQQMCDGELDGFHFGELVEDILQSV